MRSETYQYYDLPFCQPPEGLKHKKETLGEVRVVVLAALSTALQSMLMKERSQVVDGNRLVATPYDLSFRKSIQSAVLCKQQLTSRQLDIFRKVHLDCQHCWQQSKTASSLSVCLFFSCPCLRQPCVSCQHVQAVREDYYFQMFYDDLPIWGFIGRLEPEKAGSQDLRFFIYTHVQFDISYNGKQIIEIKVKTDPKVVVSPR